MRTAIIIAALLIGGAAQALPTDQPQDKSLKITITPRFRLCAMGMICPGTSEWPMPAPSNAPPPPWQPMQIKTVPIRIR